MEVVAIKTIKRDMIKGINAPHPRKVLRTALERDQGSEILRQRSHNKTAGPQEDTPQLLPDVGVLQWWRHAGQGQRTRHHPPVIGAQVCDTNFQRLPDLSQQQDHAQRFQISQHFVARW
jgi:hypothetical protein